MYISASIMEFPVWGDTKLVRINVGFNFWIKSQLDFAFLNLKLHNSSICKIFCLQFSHVSPKSFDGCKEMPWNPTNCENNDNCNHHFDWTPFAKILVHSRRLTIPKFDWHYWVGNYQVCQWGHKLSNHSDKHVEIINRCEVTIAFKMLKFIKWS